MHLVYVDDSKDEKSCCFSAIILPVTRWLDCLNHLIEFRRRIRKSHGIFATVEMHATDWIGGRGNISPAVIVRQERARLFEEALTHITKLPECSIINAHGPRKADDQLFERLCNRIQVNMERRKSHAMIISDEGKSYDGLVRRMRRFNPITGQFGGLLERKIDRIVEDIVYRESDKSLFIQAADFCAFALLRMENPTPLVEKLGLQSAFMRLDPVLEKRAFARDPRGLGIIRT